MRFVNIPHLTLPRYVADPYCERCNGRGLYWQEQNTTGGIRVTVSECVCRKREGFHHYDTRNVILVLPDELPNK